MAFRGGFFRRVGSWNVLVIFEQGTLEIDPVSYQVHYRVSVRQLLVFASVMTVAVGVLGLAQSQVPQMLPLVLLIWGWLVGANLVVGITRFRRFLARSLDKAPTGST